MKKCSKCKQKVGGLRNYLVLHEDWHRWGAEPDYRIITGFKTRPLCGKCKDERVYGYFPITLGD
jgi:hypothetical protein